ncbi:MAG: CPBP family intramembrane metalloprotease [Armatimonadetes bacterium]|nr:CPBP family intramembrane metalloprotease [Armatimonadota bacterium]NIM23340.1 CPBP family intramembrane metalloprotease [Armatimonadota bacterium]NIM67204.1 CPBP family intramembrane metalloprotease [Armatimonadota bacterium]NIM75729.1 CPBP family intramembrane metalloprotease [Armatimonadota bacterium]NIN05393.1 CPBP family intramembrane metalloprotease [Armatimonadota bacterium]
MWLVLSFLLTALILEVLFRLGLTRFNPPAMMITSFIAAILAVVWLRGKVGSGLSVGWRMNPFGLHLRVGFAIFLLSPIGMGIARLLQYYFDRDFREPSVLLVAGGGSLLLRILLLLSACVIVPVTEETVFRGLLFRGIRGRWGLFAGVVVSSAIFAVGHMDIFAALPLFIFSLGLAWSVERTGSLVPAAIAHGLFNLFPLLLLNVMTL